MELFSFYYFLLLSLLLLSRAVSPLLLTILFFIFKLHLGNPAVQYFRRQSDYFHCYKTHIHVHYLTVSLELSDGYVYNRRSH